MYTGHKKLDTALISYMYTVYEKLNTSLISYYIHCSLEIECIFHLLYVPLFAKIIATTTMTKTTTHLLHFAKMPQDNHTSSL